MSITPEQRDAWVAALRSGRYRQGPGYLRVPQSHEYCCLGVFGHAVLGIEQGLDGTELLSDLEHEELPFDVQWRLSLLNDAGMTFVQIADLLENSGDPALWA